MVATPITQSTRYINPGVTKYYFCSAIANKSAPTRPELNAGTDVTRETAAIEGWVIDSANVDTPDADTSFTGNIPGRLTAADSSFTFYADPSGADARALMPRNTNGFIVIMDGGDVAGRKMDVFPVRVASVGKVRSVEGSEAATVVIKFAVTSQPAEDVVIP
jgi:hypothetical protein